MNPKAPLDPTTTAFTVDRLASLNDGVFAVAMTLLAYNVHVPHGAVTESEMRAQLGVTEHDLGALCLSFAVAAMFWRGQVNLLQTMREGGRAPIYTFLGFLFFVVVLPITTSLYGTYGLARTVVPLYLGNLAVLAFAQLGLWGLAMSRLPLSRRERLLRMTPALFASAVFLLASVLAFFSPPAAMTTCIAAFLSPVVVRLARRAKVSATAVEDANPLQ